EPGPAAHDTARTVSALDPSRAVRRRAAVAVVVAILRPHPDIAHHVVETEPVSGKRADRRGLLGVPLAATGVALGIVRADGIGPGKGRLCPGARRILVFGPREQPNTTCRSFSTAKKRKLWHRPRKRCRPPRPHPSSEGL